MDAAQTGSAAAAPNAPLMPTASAHQPIVEQVVGAMVESMVEPVGEVRAQLLLSESHFRCHTLQAGGTTIRILPSGCIYSIERDGIQINQILASPTAGGVHRIYLRLLGDTIEHEQIVGPEARSERCAGHDRFVWSGRWRDLHYRCTCRLHADGAAWFFQIEIQNHGAEAVRVDAIMLQDVGLSARGQVRNNELYNSQYLDHAVFNDHRIGPVLMARMNLPQPNENHPWLMQGCFPAAKGFTTDGLDFFGVGHRGPHEAAALSRPIIGDRVRQHETGYTALQSVDLPLNPGNSAEITFFATFDRDHQQPSSAADLQRVEMVEAMRQQVLSSPVMPAGGVHRPVAVADYDGRAAPSVFADATAWRVDDLDPASIDRHFPFARRHEEFSGDVGSGPLHSFFYGDDARHVVLQVKERSVLRPHGHILRSGRGFTPEADLLSCACYAAGVFASQVTFGNTSLAKFLSTARDPFNLVRSSGLRIFVRDQPTGVWQLLGVPSAFEMAAEGCRWLYQCDGRAIVVACTTSEESPVLKFTVTADVPVELLFSAEIAAAPTEYDHSATLIVDARRGRLTVRPSAESLISAKHPDRALHIVAHDAADAAALGGDELLFADGRSRGLPYAAIRTRAITSFMLSLVGTDGPNKPNANGHAARPPARSTVPHRDDPAAFWNELTADVHIATPQSVHAGTLQDTLRWFARDATIHLSAPRGLEQANGGAWGVRDVCQGPIEFLLSYGHTSIAADILLKLFSQQYARRHDWPQWFMFPPFQEIQSTHCHGDVLIWPVKALCDYLEQTNDGAILQKRVPYTDDVTFQRGEQHESILQHVDHVLDKMRRDCVPGLSLPRYGDGDWDDSLQPADANLRDRMVSSWTTELMHQTLRRYAVAMAQFGQVDRARVAEQMAAEVAADFQQHLLPGGVVAGFAIFADRQPVEYLLHPADRRTGLRYRLIPMTRGIISNLFTPQQAHRHLQLIGEHLLYPDGARLMDRPTPYRGGVETVFRRAESASFFGREIGLQYVHAHLRYAEAMAVLGRADDLLRALLIVNPIAVTDVVSNARPRQRNCFFSSSDGAFTDRAHASKDYEKLRSGEIPVDGGWRIYSSGPGIYSSLVIRHFFGLRRYYDWVEFDPVLPAEFDGATCALTQAGRRVCYRFHVATATSGPRAVRINGVTIRATQEAANPYRTGGFRFPANEFEALLTLDENLVEIDL